MSPAHVNVSRLHKGGRTMPITYIKLRGGDWGLRAEGKEDVAWLGRAARDRRWPVTVTTRGGKERHELVRRVIWRDNDKHVAIATIYEAPRGSFGGDGGECPACGEVEAWECGCRHPWHGSHG
jgi:hypothetical protein